LSLAMQTCTQAKPISAASPWRASNAIRPQRLLCLRKEARAVIAKRLAEIMRVMLELGTAGRIGLGLANGGMFCAGGATAEGMSRQCLLLRVCPVVSRPTSKSRPVLFPGHIGPLTLACMRKLVFVGKVVLILLSGPVVMMAAIVVGPLYALIALVALPFLLAFEVIDRKIGDANLTSRELDRLQRIYPDVPRHLLLQARRESLMEVVVDTEHDSPTSCTHPGYRSISAVGSRVPEDRGALPPTDTLPPG
jgi:hypothetical protein